MKSDERKESKRRKRLEKNLGRVERKNERTKKVIMPRFDKKEILKIKKDKNERTENVEKLRKKLENKQNKKYKKQIKEDKVKIEEKYSEINEEELHDIIWNKIKEVNKTFPPYKYIKHMILTDLELWQFT